MSDAPPEAAPTPPARLARRAWRWQLGVRGLILLVVAAALGFTIVAERRRIADLTARVDQIRPLILTLEVEDPAQFAVVSRNEPWSEDPTWDVYLPPGRRYRVALATRGIEDDDKFPPPHSTRELAPGRHRLTLVEAKGAEEHGFAVQEGPSRLLEVPNDPTWSGGWSGSTLNLRMMTQQPIDRPLQLYRRRDYQVRSEGALLWIEVAPFERAAPAP